MIDDNDECERCCDWSNIQPYSYHRPALQVAAAFRLCRTKQNPDSSPPGGAERIQYDTDCEAFPRKQCSYGKHTLPPGYQLTQSQEQRQKMQTSGHKQQAVPTETQYQNIEQILFKI